MSYLEEAWRKPMKSVGVWILWLKKQITTWFSEIFSFIFIFSSSTTSVTSDIITFNKHYKQNKHDTVNLCDYPWFQSIMVLEMNVVFVLRHVQLCIKLLEFVDHICLIHGWDFLKMWETEQGMRISIVLRFSFATPFSYHIVKI